MKKRPEMPEAKRKMRSVMAYYKKKFGTPPPEMDAGMSFEQRTDAIRALIKAPKEVPPELE